MHLRRVLLAAAAVAAISAAAPVAAKRGDKIEGSYICVLKAGVGPDNVRAEANRAASEGGGRINHVYENSIHGFSANFSAAAAAQVAKRNPNIAYCEQDQEVTADQDALVFRELGKPVGGTPTQPAQSTPWGIARVNGVKTVSPNRAWIIDTGIDLDHPDLNVDTARSRNFVTRETSPDDLNGHGSHVAGTIAARDNGIGVIGVVPGTAVVAVRVLNRRGSGSNSDVIAGVDYVGANGSAGDVANMSLGGGVSAALDSAVVNASNNKGVKFALAAGNESDDANNHSPGRANGPNIFTVSAFGQQDKWASFSNYGNPPIDFAEPGVGILSTYKDGGYATLSGTSMATPHLAGLLLAGTVRSGGTVGDDPDPNNDTIGVH